MANPTKINVTVKKDPTTHASEANFEADGTFWLTNRQIMPIHCKADGSQIEELSADGVNVYSASTAAFNYGKKKYLATTATNSGWDQGKVVLVDITNGAANGVSKFTMPSSGHFGNGNWGNTAGYNKVVHQLSGDNHSTLKIWALVPYQGIGMWKFEGKKGSGVENIVVDDENAPVEYYNMQGVRMTDENLAPGLYIKRQGKKATKVVIR